MTWKTHSKLHSIQSHVLSPDFPKQHCFNKPLNLKIRMFLKGFILIEHRVIQCVFLFPSYSKPSSFQEVYLRRRACEALGCQGKEMGAIGALALKKAAEDGEKPTSSLQLGGVCGVDDYFLGLQHQPRIF